MAQKALIDSHIDAFWKAAGGARPTTPQDLIRRNQPVRKPGGGSKSARGPGEARQSSASAYPHSARRAAPEAEAHPEFRHITVELSGREGYNAIAINGIWRFWRVKGGRLAFRRDVELQVEAENIEEEEGCSDDSAVASAEAAAQRSGAADQTGVATVRLFLFYAPQVDSWLISDTPDSSGSVTGDCGPVGDDEDLSNNWRVWDGERWCEDRNIVVEVALGCGVGAPAIPNLKGLRVVPSNATRQRACSQEPRVGNTALPRAPISDKPLDSSRPRRSARK